MHNNLLQANAISYRRGHNFLFKLLDISAEPGKLLQIVGQNGVGKTTLLRVLTGLLPPDAGEIHWQGKSIQQNLLAYQAALFYIDHRLALKPSLTLLENIRLDQRLPRLTRQQLESALMRFDLLELVDRPLGQLSRGQQQRVALARVACSHAALLILDEPFTALDDASIIATQQLFMERLAAGHIIIITSHRALTLDKALVQTLTLGRREVDAALT